MTAVTAPQAFAVPLEPDHKAALTFFATLYPTGRGEIIHFRGVPEPKDGRPPHNLHYALDEHGYRVRDESSSVDPRAPSIVIAGESVAFGFGLGYLARWSRAA